MVVRAVLADPARRVQMRLKGLLLAAIARQFVISGASEAWHAAAR